MYDHDVLDAVCRDHGTSVPELVLDAARFFHARQLRNGSIIDDPAVPVFEQWDTVNAVASLARWSEITAPQMLELRSAALQFLAGSEKPNGMVSWGAIEIGPGEYCTETSSEYVSALHLLGEEQRARRGAAFLRARQLPTGAWEEVHPHIPRAFQTEPSVTGFALEALLRTGTDPLHLDAALNFLACRQRPEGHFGLNWYYYNTHYYLMRSAVAVLAEFGHHTAVSRARDFVLGRQRADGSWDTRPEGFEQSSTPELHTALALATLAHCGIGVDEPAAQRAVDWLLARRRPDGSWDGGRYPYPQTDSYHGFATGQDVFTTAQVLSAFHTLVAKEHPS